MYLDIQLLLSGEEWIGIVDHIPWRRGRTDNPHPDLYFMDEPSTTYVGLQPGDFVAIAPGELHTPLCTPDGTGSVTQNSIQGAQSAVNCHPHNLKEAVCLSFN